MNINTRKKSIDSAVIFLYYSLQPRGAAVQTAQTSQNWSKITVLRGFWLLILLKLDDWAPNPWNWIQRTPSHLRVPMCTLEEGEYFLVSTWPFWSWIYQCAIWGKIIQFHLKWIIKLWPLMFSTKTLWNSKIVTILVSALPTFLQTFPIFLQESAQVLPFLFTKSWVIDPFLSAHTHNSFQNVVF